MKRMSLAILWFLGSTGLVMAAGPYGGMSPADQQRLMMAAQKMQACMQGISRSEINELQRRGKAMHDELRQLCAAGKRREAYLKAFKYAKEINAMPVMVKMQKCSAEFRKAMPQGMPGMGAGMDPRVYVPPVGEKGSENLDICGEL